MLFCYFINYDNYILKNIYVSYYCMMRYVQVRFIILLDVKVSYLCVVLILLYIIDNYLTSCNYFYIPNKSIINKLQIKNYLSNKKYIRNYNLSLQINSTS
jgi:hypothetical protein